MSFSSAAESSSVTQFKSFISESELEERKKKRQEEWEKVRTEEQPIEAPEEEYCSRSLYDRLKEQKDKKDLEYEEAHKLKNMIKVLDDDEVSFLDLVDRSKEEEENKRWKEEMKEIREYRKAVSELSDESVDNKRTAIKKIVTANLQIKKKSQSSLLSGIVKVKRKSEESSSRGNTTKPSVSDEPKAAEKSDEIKTNLYHNDSRTCIGILPGVGEYNSDSSDSERSSSSELADYDCDLLHRPKKRKICQ